MPVVFSNPLYPSQAGFGGVQAVSTQLDYRSMLNEVTAWNPDLDPEIAGRFINNAYRNVIDRRSWYGLKLRGQISVISPSTPGQVSMTYGSKQVTGIGTAFNQSIVGLQFRNGFTLPYSTITNVVSPTVIFIDIPWGGVTSVTGYQINQAWVTMGGNIKRMLWAVNQQQGWPMAVNGDASQESINAWDTWRTNLGWSKYMSPLPPTPDGQYQVELWPTPFSTQVFPFEAYQQPPDLTLDGDSPVSWIRSDILVTRALADALVWRGRQSKYYDPVVSGMKMKQFEDDVEKMVMNDDNQDLQDVTWDFGGESSGNGEGSYWAQSHA